MTLLQLQYFQVLARMLHYTKTAEALHISQPSLSYAINGLESELGVKLFEKKERKTVLTPFGEAFLPFVEQSLSSLEEGRSVLNRMNDEGDKTLNLGYFHSLSGTLIPSIMEEYYEDRKNRAVRIRFTEETPDEIARQVREGTLDLGFSPRKEEGAECVQVMNQPLYLAVPAGHPLSAKKSVTFADFQDEPLILLERSSVLRKQIDEGYREQGMESKPVLEVKECNVALQYVRLEFGVAVIPEVPAAETSRVTLLPVLDGKKEYSRPVYLFWNKNRTLSKTAEQFRDFVAERFAR